MGVYRNVVLRPLVDIAAPGCGGGPRPALGFRAYLKRGAVTGSGCEPTPS